MTIRDAASPDLYYCNYDSEKPVLRIFFRCGNGEFKDSGCRFTPSDHTWVGAKTGLYALARTGAKSGIARFRSVTAEEL